jgi:septal ring factor EnvC (AmiA/AmiB activator)
MRIALFIFCLLLSAATNAQVQTQSLYTKAQLEAKRKELQDAIRETENQLEAIKQNKNATMGQLRALQNKLSQRQNLIVNINDELSDIDKDIRSSSNEVQTLKQKLDQLKTRYAQSIRYAYSTRSSYDMMAFLFSSRDFNDAMRRMKYLKKFRDFRKEQVEEIRITQGQLQRKIGTLNATKAQKDELLITQVQQKEALLKETDQTNQVIQDLKGKESQLMKDIEKNRQIANRVNKAINDIIQREIAKAAKLAEEEAKRKAAEEARANPGAAPARPVAGNPATNNPSNVNPRIRAPKAEAPSLLSTPTDVALAANFEGNKGKLYWPVDKGYITDHFGTHPHPLAPKVLIENNGIDIQTEPNATVKAVFEGTVSAVVYVDGQKKMVMVQHGNFFTVYNNLESTSVKKDQHVNTNQPIGTVAVNDEGEPTIKFQIWKVVGKSGTTKLNPELWIGRAH